MTDYQKRHYEAIASILSEGRQMANGRPDLEQLMDVMVSRFMELFRRDNPNFSSTRFIDAVNALGA